MHLIEHLGLLQLSLWFCSAAVDYGTFEQAFVAETEHQIPPNQFLEQVENALLDCGSRCTATTRFTFRSPYFTGSSFYLECDSTLKDERILRAVQDIPGVVKSWPARSHDYLPLSVREPSYPTSARQDLAYRDAVLSEDATHDTTGDVLSTHIETQVSRLHAANITGMGIRIAVVDSGFDLSVPGLSSTRVGYTHDVTSGAVNVADNCSIHGTHVLGIVGAKGSTQYGVQGVAYDATFELYRVRDCSEPGVRTDALLHAILEAAGRGVDIITCSLGGRLAFPEDLLTLTANRISNDGTFVAFAAGNVDYEDSAGPFRATGLSGAVATVGASDNTVSPCYQWEGSMVLSGRTIPFKFTPGDAVQFPEHRLTVWSPSRVFTDAAPSNCTRIGDDIAPPADPVNSIILKLISQCWVDADDVEISRSAKYGGNIRYEMVYMRPGMRNSESCPMVFQVGTKNLTGIIGISWEDGRAMFDELSRGGTVTVSLPSNHLSGHESVTNTKNSATGGLVSTFSAWGPTFDVESMISFVAPGGNILSTFPARLGGWGVVGGTSMATPFAAGVAALVKQRHPHWKSSQIRTALVLTAKPVLFKDRIHDDGYTSNFLAPVIQQGGGLLDAWAAVHITALTDVSVLNFNDTAHRPTFLAFTITNICTTSHSFDLQHIGAASGYLRNLTGGALYNFTRSQGLPIYAELTINPSHVVLAPNQSATISVSVKAEPALPKTGTRLSYFGGYISIIDKQDTSTLSLPYTGIGGNLSALPVINRDQSFFASVNPETRATARIPANRVFICKYNRTAEIPAQFPADGLYPGISLVLVTQTRSLTIEVVDQKSGNVVIPLDYSAGSNKTWAVAQPNWWDGSDGGGIVLKEGAYVWRVRARRLNADWGVEEGAWDVWDSEAWELRYAAGSTGLS